MTERSHNSDYTDRLVDELLGLDYVSAAEGVDPERDATELRGLFDDLRGLSAEPTGRVQLAVRNAVDRRVRLRRPEQGPRISLAQVLTFAKVAAIAAVVVGIGTLAQRFVGGVSSDTDAEHVAQVSEPLREGLMDAIASRQSADEAVPTRRVPESRPRTLRVEPQRADGKIVQPYRRYEMDQAVVQRYSPMRVPVEDIEPAEVFVGAANAVASLRLEFSNRLDPFTRRQAIRAGGGSALLAARIETLADEIAAKIAPEIDSGAATVRDVAMSLRAMMAGGSTLQVGAHRAQVRQCADHLVGRLADLEGGELATALAGLMDVAVVAGPEMGQRIGEHVVRLTESILYSNNEHRPTMLNWQTSAAELADAGQVLRLAPAFGAMATETLLARSYLATHLSERIALSTEERPDLLAAKLYGFGDLIDRDDVEHKLSLWRARDLVPKHYAALHHVAWSRFPLRSGWADFQMELRTVSAIATPQSCADASALLLALAVHYAAPGSQELIALASRP